MGYLLLGILLEIIPTTIPKTAQVYTEITYPIKPVKIKCTKFKKKISYQNKNLSSG